MNKEEGREKSPFLLQMGIRILLVADTHEKYTEKKVKSIDRYAFDYCISLGDVKVETLETLIKICKKRNTPIYAVQGNNDDCGAFLKLPYVKDLFRTRRMIGSLTCIGMEGCYRPNYPGVFNYSDEETVTVMKHFPAVDILFAHDSIKTRDICPEQFWLALSGWKWHSIRKWGHEGMERLSRYIAEKNPTYFFHGHHHVNVSYRYGNTQCYGVKGFAIFDLNTENIIHIM